MEFSKSQEKRIAIQKGLITPERLAEIIDEITQRALSQNYSNIYFDFLVNELLKKCEIKEKE